MVALCMLLSLHAKADFDWEVEVDINGIWYCFDTDNKVAAVLGADGDARNVTIPSSVIYNGSTYTVTIITDYAFSDFEGLTSVTIPNSITDIWDGAFENCIGLTSITIPNSVTFIGQEAFYNCRGLTSVASEIEEPFSFGSYAFYGIASTCTLTIPLGTRNKYIAKGWNTNVFKGGILSPQIIFPSDSELIEFGIKPTLQLIPEISGVVIKQNEFTWASSDDNIASVL